MLVSSVKQRCSTKGWLLLNRDIAQVGKRCSHSGLNQPERPSLRWLRGLFLEQLPKTGTPVHFVAKNRLNLESSKKSTSQETQLAKDTRQPFLAKSVTVRSHYDYSTWFTTVFGNSASQRPLLGSLDSSRLACKRARPINEAITRGCLATAARISHQHTLPPHPSPHYTTPAHYTRPIRQYYFDLHCWYYDISSIVTAGYCWYFCKTSRSPFGPFIYYSYSIVPLVYIVSRLRPTYTPVP